MSGGTEESETKHRDWEQGEGERGGQGGGLDHQFPVPPDPSVPPRLLLLPPSPFLQPVAISDFLGNLRNNTSERAPDSDIHNKPASVSLNPTHKSLK